MPERNERAARTPDRPASAAAPGPRTRADGGGVRGGPRPFSQTPAGSGYPNQGTASEPPFALFTPIAAGRGGTACPLARTAPSRDGTAPGTV